MRDCDEKLEQAFFALFQRYYDLEQDAGKQHDPANYSLDRMFPLAALAGNPEKRLRVIHVAGTKGKGSTSHFISSLLGACGAKAGLFTSPHLATVRERFQLQNQLISYEKLLGYSRRFLAMLDKSGMTPSLFEIFTVLALWIFAEEGMEWAVLETGIGGRLDATNYISSPECTVITPVSFDHVALLGHTIDAIAGEKAGIIKAGVPLVLAPQPFPLAEQVIRARATELGAPLFQPEICGNNSVLPSNYPSFLRDNFRVAEAVMRVLQMVPDWTQFQLPVLRGRCEQISANPLVVLDVAHNQDSMEKLVTALKTLYPDVRFTVILGVVQGKDVAGIVSALKELEGEYILTNPHTAKGSALETLKKEAQSAGLAVKGVIEQLSDISQLPAGKPLLFTGSFFTASIGELLFSTTKI